MAETPKRHCPNCGHELSLEDQLNGHDGAAHSKSKSRTIVALNGIICVMVVVVVVLLLGRLAIVSPYITRRPRS